MDSRRHFAIFTTASLPWMTGTAVNPLFRAAYLAKDGNRKVTLVVPWLSLKDQKFVYPDSLTFSLPSEQESYIRKWLQQRTGFLSDISIRFYAGKFSTDKRSILGAGDISEVISDEEADIAVLEEPEHLTWYHHGKSWKSKFGLVVGVVHTNYLEYVKREKHGQINAFFLKFINYWVVDIYCHKVIRLSGATQNLPRSVVCNVHGVNPKFLETSKKMRDGKEGFSKGCYYIGKMVWSKGYRELLQLLEDHQKELSGLEVDLFGSGEDSSQVHEAVSKFRLDVRVHPGLDHADPLFHDYKVLLNPSTSDVVCTTTAEALSMNKLVICADHPSNAFFKRFPNCITFEGRHEFVDAVYKALAMEPCPLNDHQMHELSWEAATQRFLEVARVDPSSVLKKDLALKMRETVEGVSTYVHRVALGMEASRRIVGAVPWSLEPDEDQCRELGMGLSETHQLGEGV